jgi:hypothetical protein
MKEFGVNDQQFLNKKRKYFTKINKAYKKALEVQKWKKETLSTSINNSDYSVMRKELHFNVINSLASPTRLHKTLFSQQSFSYSHLNTIGSPSNEFTPAALSLKHKSRSNTQGEFDC